MDGKLPHADLQGCLPYTHEYMEHNTGHDSLSIPGTGAQTGLVISRWMEGDTIYLTLDPHIFLPYLVLLPNPGNLCLHAHRLPPLVLHRSDRAQHS